MLPTSLPERVPAARGGLGGASAAITVEGLAKTFRLPRLGHRTLKERVLHPLRAREVDELRALRDVSVTVTGGEFFGVVGRNGSGKSTLLKCLAGIYEADRGSVAIHGKLSPFIELGVGFNAELTARDNVLINAILLGLSRREARERFDRIIAFAELEEFLDLKLKNYSSGMQVRLAFAVATQVDADVLLVDEVLAVGDAAFQQKCFAQFQRLKEAGRTIVFVTHDMHAVERFCDRALLLERGEVVHIGDPHDVARAYNQLNFGRLVHDDIEGTRLGSHAAAEITAAWFEDGAGERVTSIGQGDALRVAMEIRFHAELDDPVFGFSLRNQVGHTIFATRTDVHGERTGHFTAGDTATMRVALDNRLAPSDYRLTPSIARAEAAVGDALDLREDLAQLTVHGSHLSGGVVDLAHEIDVERS
jgi:ABC-type polysaccharide/polyol phosphate transport system ATPase subunit